MVYMRLLLLAALTVSISPALDFCVKNEGGLDSQTLMLTLHYLRQHQDRLGTSLNPSCSASAVRITFGTVPESPHPPDALGATRTVGGRILSEIRIFARAVENQLPGASVETRARALAKVAAHELSHYLHQEAKHSHGLDRPVFDTQALIALE